MNRAELESFMDNLYEIGCVKFGEFYLSTGLKTPVYFDLRLIISYPKILQQAARLIQQIIADKNIKYDLICGVPYGALALAVVLSIQTDKPLILKRKNTKDYGEKMVEGAFEKSNECLLIEDTVVFGSSVIETAQVLKDYDLNSNVCIGILDREQGGAENIGQHGLLFYSIIKASEFVEYLVKKGKITQEKMNEVIIFLKSNLYESKDKNIFPVV
ncbi:uridine 5 -monophosphate synthase [Brachionus plicatilis]|uniref:orotate phosphoribosyltransferase n=1 Tax=Brachionus plicatilis TaxID=10195 RepID=A0A3M7R6A5_BRAPC|nr:uridine 5 -monophosphate synthase [Brachionus plicatilis]